MLMHQVDHFTSRESILVVDQNPATWRLLTHLLAQRGYQVRFASSGNLALEAIQVHLPELILLDISLPEDGYSLCQSIKSNPHSCHVPVILLSSHEAIDSARAMAVGSVDWIAKSCSADEALTRIETQVNQQRLQKQLIEQSMQLQQEICQRQQAEAVLEQQRQKTVLLKQIADTVRTQTDSQPMFETIVAQIGQAFQVSRCSIHIYVPPPMPEMPLVAEYVRFGWASMQQLDFSIEESLLISDVLTQDQAMIWQFAGSNDRSQLVDVIHYRTDIQSLLAVRTSYCDQTNGLITLQQCDRQRHWTADEIALIEVIAAQVGIALAQTKLLAQDQKQLEALSYQNSVLRQEICDRRQVETALQASEAEIRGLFAAMRDVILVFDRQGCYLKVAPSNQPNLYKPAQDLVGATLHEVFSAEQADRFLHCIQACLETQTTVDYEYSLTIQGEELWFDAKVSPISQETVIWVARNITARKRAEADLLSKSIALTDFSQHLKQLHRLSLTDFETIEALCADYLKTGCEIFGFVSGIVGKIHPSTYQLLAVHSAAEFMVPGVHNLSDVYCNQVVQAGKTVYYQAIGQIEQMRCHPMYQRLKIESYIGTPIWVDGELYGTLCFFSLTPRLQGFERQEQEVIELMAQSIGKFINAHQFNAKQKQAEEEIQLLLTITQAIAAASDFDQALYLALRALCETTGWIYGEVWLPSADGSRLECSPVWYCHQVGQSPLAVASVKRMRQNVEGLTFRPGEGIAGRVWSQQQSEWTIDVENPPASNQVASEPFQYRFQLVNHYGVKARLGVPIPVMSDRGLGEASGQATTVLAVLVFFTVEARQQEKRLIQLVSAIAAQLGTVLAQKQAEAELKALFTAMDDLVLVRDAAGRCLKVASVSANAYKPAASLLGKTLHETLPEPVADQILLGIQASLANYRTVQLEYSLPIADREICLAASISPLAENLVLIVARDISDRKQVEEALARRERYLAALVEVQRQLLEFREQQTQSMQILQLLGQVAAASRVTLYEHHRDQEGRQQMALQAVWHDSAEHNLTRRSIHFYEHCPRWIQSLASGQILSTPIAEFPAAERRLLEAEGVEAILVLPLTVRGEFWGFIEFDHYRPHTWDLWEINLLNTAATAIALHHDRKLTEAALRQSAEREQATLRVIERMRQTLDIEQIFRTTAAELRPLLHCDRVLIYRFHSDWSGEFVAESVGAGWAPVFESPDELDFTPPENDCCQVKTLGSTYLSLDSYLQETQGGIYRNGVKYLCVQDIYAANFSDCYLQLLEKLEAKAYLIVPIFLGHRLWGLLAAYQNSSPREWQTSDIQLVTHISTQLGVALQQTDLLAQMQHQSSDLAKARDAAETANRAKTQFLANMSHELRTPLNSILGFTQLIGQEAVLTPEQRNYLSIINQSGQHLLDLINDVLELAKLEADRLSLQASQFDLRGLLGAIEEMLSLIAVEKQLELSCIITPEVPRYVVADKSKLRQVLLNLLDNAIKFTRVGSVTLRVTALQVAQSIADASLPQRNLESERNPELEPNLKPERIDEADEPASQQAWLQFEVIDTGFGIAPEEMDSLFKAFVQTEAGRQSNQGTGLGLVISNRFVQLMGGQLQVRSVLSQGSVFAFDLPVQVVTEQTFAAARSQEPMSANINYLQLEPVRLNHFPRPVKLTVADLAVMPVDWIISLHHAASGCSDRQILQLVEQIPPAASRLADSLEDLAYNFRFEEIIELTKSYIS